MMDPALLCRIFFSLGTAVAIGGTIIPPFREHIMNYGPRSTTSTTISEQHKTKITRFLEYVGSFQVLHAWFTHYYVVSVASSVFWAHQIYTHGTAFKFLASLSESRPATMTLNQVFLAWLFMAVQGVRRLYESIVFTKQSQSRMWAGLWIIGIAFYVFMGISVWIEGMRRYLGLSSVW
jgi:3-oxo-5-alpha-steroid 4-dehydrogenase 3